MNRNQPLYIFLFIFLPCIFLCADIHAADKKNQLATIKSIDSLNQLAASQKSLDVAKSLSNLFIAEELAKSVDYQSGLALNYLYQGGIFMQIGYDKRALSIYYKSLQIYKTLNDTFHVAMTSQQIAHSLQNDLQTEEALRLYNESLTVYQQLNKQEEIVNIKNSIGDIYIRNRSINRAEVLFREALSKSKEINYAYGEQKALYSLGLLEKSRKNILAARKYFQSSMSMDSVSNDNYGISLNLLQLSDLKQRESEYDNAILLAKKAYSVAAQIPAYSLLNEAASKVIEGFRMQGDIGKASQWQDSLLKILQLQNKNEKEYALNFIDVIKSQDAKNSNAEKDLERQRQVQKEQLLIITVGTFVLIVVAVLAVLALVNYQRQRFFGRELKQKNEIIERNSASLDQLNKEISSQNLLLEEDNKTKNKLLSIISHDLRTPLVNTKGVLNLVNQGMVPPEEADRLLQLLETQYLGTTSLLDNLLFWIKGQMEGKEDVKVKVGLYLLMKNLEEEHRLPLIKKKIQLRNHIDRNVSIVTEKEMIRIVCRNLISNAIKFTNENGWIELNSRIEEDADGKILFLTVKDSGIGMTQEAIEKVNAKQYYNTTGTSYEKGSGFGLMLCRDLISKNGGELIIESEPGAGSSFTIKMRLTES
ncbi:MAG: hypothetical protein KGO92_07015 [Bacteroidota bacterium]|nr:hypothetical protein [Bacteroidota bacterium]